MLRYNVAVYQNQNRANDYHWVMLNKNLAHIKVRGILSNREDIFVYWFIENLQWMWFSAWQ